MGARGGDQVCRSKGKLILFTTHLLQNIDILKIGGIDSQVN